jgi:hypothetical protein
MLARKYVRPNNRKLKNNADWPSSIHLRICRSDEIKIPSSIHLRICRSDEIKIPSSIHLRICRSVEINIKAGRSFDLYHNCAVIFIKANFHSGSKISALDHSSGASRRFLGDVGSNVGSNVGSKTRATQQSKISMVASTGRAVGPKHNGVANRNPASPAPRFAFARLLLHAGCNPHKKKFARSLSAR